MGLLKTVVRGDRELYVAKMMKDLNIDSFKLIKVLLDFYMEHHPEYEVTDADKQLMRVPLVVQKLFSECTPGRGHMPEAEFWSIKKIASALKISNYNRSLVHWMKEMGYEQKISKVKGKAVKGYWVVSNESISKSIPKEIDLDDLLAI